MNNAYYIYPESINCYDKYDTKWIALCTAMGYFEAQDFLLVLPITPITRKEC